MTQPIVNLAALADKLSTRQRAVVAANALDSKATDKWGKIGNEVRKAVKHTGFYV